MNTLVRNIGIYVIGLVCGSLSTYILVKKKFEDRADDEIAQMKEYYETKSISYDELVKAGKIVEKKAPVEEKNEKQPEPPKEYVAKPNEDSLTRGRYIDYTAFYRDKEHPEDDDSYEDNYASGLEMTKDFEKNKDREPKLIAAEDFGSEPNYNKMFLLYYTESDVLTLNEDQDEEIINDFDEIEAMLGDSLTKFGFIDNDEEVIYVRNTRRTTDYEIRKVFGQFTG